MIKLTPKQQEYFIINGDKTYPILCKICPNPVKWNASTGQYRIYCCPECKFKDKSCQTIKQKETNLRKFGVEFPMQSKKIQDKTKQTNLERFGVEHPLQSDIIKENRRQTNIKKFGGASPNYSKEVQDKTKQTCLDKHGFDHPWKVPQIRKNIKQTFLTIYGMETIGQVPELREKIKETCLVRHGALSPLGSVCIKEKIKQCWMDTRGVENPSQLEEVKEKKRQTCFKNHGVEYPSQSLEIQENLKQVQLGKYGVEFYNQQHIKEQLPNLLDHDWLFDQYITQGKTTVSLADELGTSSTTIGNYLKKVEIQMKPSTYSYKSILWLEQIMKRDNIYIQHALNGGEYRFPEMRRCEADGFCKATNTIYEFHGDCWHGNLKRYEPEYPCHPFNKKTASELYQATIERENKIKALGYNLVVMWESDFI
ncbi:hypothetical protein M0R04_07040 [Candidatus Dojkabacteria bacterium]|nr:hypothetical protein [Candidatus Dojkabacteria bacterium]